MRAVSRISNVKAAIVRKVASVVGLMVQTRVMAVSANASMATVIRPAPIARANI